MITFGYFWGRRQNKKIVLSALTDLISVVKPDDQTFTNIGGAIGYHANLLIRKKRVPVSQVDATITLLPRHSWLYMPISKLIRKYDRLFITVYLTKNNVKEFHLIESKYEGFRKSTINSKEHLLQNEVLWGMLYFNIYYQSQEMHEKCLKFIEANPEPGTIRHLAIIPHQKKGFIFMIPRRGQVLKSFSPAYQWMVSFFSN